LLSDGRRGSRRFTLVISCPDPSLLLAEQLSFRVDPMPQPDASERDLELPVEPRFLLVKLGLCHAQRIRPGIVRARVIAVDRRRRSCSGVRKQQ